MHHLFKSATQFVLVLFAVVLSLSLLYVVALNPHDHDMGMALHGLFANAMIGVISFYFGQKGLPTPNTITTMTSVDTNKSPSNPNETE